MTGAEPIQMSSLVVIDVVVSVLTDDTFLITLTACVRVLSYPPLLNFTRTLSFLLLFIAERIICSAAQLLKTALVCVMITPLGIMAVTRLAACSTPCEA